MAIATVGALLIGAVAFVLEDLISSGRSNGAVVQNDQPDPVEKQFRDMVAANPDDAGALTGLANYLSNTGRVGEAVPLFEKALNVKPDDWSTRLAFARALAQGDKRADAELQYRKVIAAQPNNAQAYFGLGQLYGSWVPARPADAIAAYQAAIAADGASFVAQRSTEELAKLGVASPAAGTPLAGSNPSASPTASPVGG